MPKLLPSVVLLAANSAALFFVCSMTTHVSISFREKWIRGLKWKHLFQYITALLSYSFGLGFLIWELIISLKRLFFNHGEIDDFIQCLELWGSPLLWLFARLFVQLFFLARISLTFSRSSFALSNQTKRIVAALLWSLYLPMSLLCLGIFIHTAINEQKKKRNHHHSNSNTEDYQSCNRVMSSSLDDPRSPLLWSLISFFFFDGMLTAIQLRMYLRRFISLVSEKNPMSNTNAVSTSTNGSPRSQGSSLEPSSGFHFHRNNDDINNNNQQQRQRRLRRRGSKLNGFHINNNDNGMEDEELQSVSSDSRALSKRMKHSHKSAEKKKHRHRFGRMNGSDKGERVHSRESSLVNTISSQVRKNSQSMVCDIDPKIKEPSSLSSSAMTKSKMATAKTTTMSGTQSSAVVVSHSSSTVVGGTRAIPVMTDADSRSVHSRGVSQSGSIEGGVIVTPLPRLSRKTDCSLHLANDPSNSSVGGLDISRFDLLQGYTPTGEPSIVVSGGMAVADQAECPTPVSPKSAVIRTVETDTGMTLMKKEDYDMIPTESPLPSQISDGDRTQFRYVMGSKDGSSTTNNLSIIHGEGWMSLARIKAANLTPVSMSDESSSHTPSVPSSGTMVISSPTTGATKSRGLATVPENSPPLEMERVESEPTPHQRRAIYSGIINGGVLKPKDRDDRQRSRSVGDWMTNESSPTETSEEHHRRNLSLTGPDSIIGRLTRVMSVRSMRERRARERERVIHEEMKRLAARNSFLVLTAMVSTLTLVFGLFPLLGTLVFTMDLCVSALCIYFCFAISEPVFRVVCGPCFECSVDVFMPALFVICDWDCPSVCTSDAL